MSVCRAPCLPSFVLAVITSVHLVSGQPTKRTPEQKALTGYIIAIIFVIVISFGVFMACCVHGMGRRRQPVPTPQEISDQVGALRARVQQLEAERTAGALPVTPTVPGIEEQGQRASSQISLFVDGIEREMSPGHQS
ncbi:hypothetical protein FB451DRAFT_1398577 [Mycena latifolia]|nr:hypothetical protein FB451DRAFT_1398577 [Mycena latifolia]